MRLRPYLWGGSAWALLYFACGFHPGLAVSDDFGYLRSVLMTLAAHRPQAYDWLEPYAAAFSGACALLYALTGSFTASTWGFQAFCGLAFYPLLARLFASRLRPGHAAFLALSVAAFPLFFAKAADFHAAFCTLDLVLCALLAFEARRWGAFFLAAFLAFANRQNQICLLVLPWAFAWREAGKGRRVTRAILIGTFAWACAAAALSLSMNRTYAAAHAAYRSETLPALASHAARALAAGGYLALGWLALASLVTGRVFGVRPAGGRAIPAASVRAADPGPGSTGSGSTEPGLPVRRAWFLRALMVAGLLAFLPAWGPDLLRTDTPLFALAAWPQVNRILPWLLLALLPCLDLRLLRRTPYLSLIAAYVGIASLRGIWWDYYFLEISVVALLLALDGIPAPALPRPSLPRFSLAALAVLLAFDCGYAYLYKIQSDKQRLAIQALERLEREGRIGPEAMTGGAFGHLGWKLFDYYAAHAGPSAGELHEFLNYVRRDRVLVETGLPWRRGYKDALPDGADSLAGGFRRIGFAIVPYRIIDAHGPRAEEPLLGRDLRLDPRFLSPRYPLDDREWDEIIRDGALK